MVLKPRRCMGGTSKARTEAVQLAFQLHPPKGIFHLPWNQPRQTYLRYLRSLMFPPPGERKREFESQDLSQSRVRKVGPSIVALTIRRLSKSAMLLFF